MKHNITVDTEKRLEALLAEAPCEPSAGFSDRVCEACLNEIIDAKFAEMPISPSAEFSSRVMAQVRLESNVLKFPASIIRFRRFLRVTMTGAVAVFAVCVGTFSLNKKTPLTEQVASILSSDPELAQLAMDEDEFSLNELVSASRILTALNDNSDQTADFFAYYEN
jgi:hypothetical protein